MREFTYVFILGGEIACAGQSAWQMSNRVATMPNLDDDKRDELGEFIDTCDAGAYMQIDGQSLLLCSYVSPDERERMQAEREEH